MKFFLRAVIASVHEKITPLSPPPFHHPPDTIRAFANQFFSLSPPLQIEDEGNHGNDETRLFILSSLAAQHKSRVACVLCEEPMLVFDRYPLVDGTFFLSPKQHAKGCIEVSRENWLRCICLLYLSVSTTGGKVNDRPSDPSA